MNLADSEAHSKDAILCVDIDAADLPISIRALMNDHAFELVHCDSVYEAMAKVGKLKPVIALVRVDWLTAAEFEFFSICARTYPELCIFVAGHDRSQAKFDQAISLGASARLSVSAVEGILAEQNYDADADSHGDTGFDGWSDSAVSSSGADFPQNNSETFANPDNEFDAESEAHDLEQVAEDGSKTDLSAPNVRSTIDPGGSGGIEIKGADVSGADYPGADNSDIGGDSDSNVNFSTNAPSDSSDNLSAGVKEPAADWGVETPEDNAENALDEPDLDKPDLDDDSDDETRPVMVPWSDSERGSNRVPPKRVAPASAQLSEEHAPDDPPLLSQEELSLLLGE